VKKVFYILFSSIFIFGCSKKEEELPTPITEPEQWERFAGDYKVYDILGNFLYDMSLVHFYSGNNIYQNDVDSVIIQNFADTFDLKYEFRRTIDKNLLDIGFHDSIVDRNNKSWHLTRNADDENTPIRENKLINDTIIMYFRLNNIKYYIQEAQPYYYCDCKHIAVKQ
jgi:hypothetical protein